MSVELRSNGPGGPQRRVVANTWAKQPEQAASAVQALLAAGATLVTLVELSGCGCGGRAKAEKIVRTWP